MKTLEKILYIEDEADIQAIARLALEALGGFVVETCSSACEGVARGSASAPDLILLDVMMPDMDGPATLLALRQLPGLAGVPVVFMTAKVQPQEVAHYRALGALPRARRTRCHRQAVRSDDTGRSGTSNMVASSGKGLDRGTD